MEIITDESLQQRYSSLSTDDLIELDRTSDLTELGKRILEEILAERGVTHDDKENIVQQLSTQEFNNETQSDYKNTVFWPNVNIEAGLKYAIKYGVLAAIWPPLLNLLYILKDKTFYSVALLSDEKYLLFSTFIIFFYLFLAYRISIKTGYISAIIVLLTSVLTLGQQILITASGTHIHSASFISLLMIFFAIHGVRGTIRARKNTILVIPKEYRKTVKSLGTILHAQIGEAAAQCGDIITTPYEVAFTSGYLRGFIWDALDRRGCYDAELILKIIKHVCDGILPRKLWDIFERGEAINEISQDSNRDELTLSRDAYNFGLKIGKNDAAQADIDELVPVNLTKYLVGEGVKDPNTGILVRPKK